MVLTREQARTFYDRFGKKQDGQAFYEDAALAELIAHSAFEEAEKVFEFGCGTGRFALRLLEKHLPPSASYFGIDISETMIDIAERRISPYSDRAKVVQTDGSMSFPVSDWSVDRVVSTFVLDLLPETDIRGAINESSRVLKPGGKLSIASLTTGTTLISRVVSTLWWVAFRLHAGLVGGCRPIQIDSYFDPDIWSIEYSRVITQLGVPSGVVIASLNSMPTKSLRPIPKSESAELHRNVA